MSVASKSEEKKPNWPVSATSVIAPSFSHRVTAELVDSEGSNHF
jgi:hypothetical protein